jgi:Cu2+-exporting ATPase
VLLLAAGAAAAWSVIDPTRAVWVAVAVLIVTCPCALSLAAPAALVASPAAWRGAACCGAAAGCRRAPGASTTVLRQDRHAELERTQLTAAGESEFGDAAIALELVLARAASLAAWSTHPVSRALVAAAGEGGRNAEPPWHGIEEVAGRGLRAVDAQGREWRLGAAHWVRAVQADLAPADDDTAHTGLGRDGVLLARFEFGEAVREGAREAVQALQREGIAVSLLSGDTPARAQRLAERVGITDVVGGATPADKLAVLEAAQAAGRVVAMVGDGVNDAPVLARADVSLAMGQGALVARGQADAVIASGHLADVVSARARARRTLAIVRQNMVWAAAYNAVCIPLALVGWLPPWAAGLGMAGSSLAVVLNALRASR